jgi:hypothetical protein
MGARTVLSLAINHESINSRTLDMMEENCGNRFHMCGQMQHCSMGLKIPAAVVRQYIRRTNSDQWKGSPA